MNRDSGREPIISKPKISLRNELNLGVRHLFVGESDGGIVFLFCVVVVGLCGGVFWLRFRLCLVFGLCFLVVLGVACVGFFHFMV
jgi:hypothetical protein